MKNKFIPLVSLLALLFSVHIKAEDQPTKEDEEQQEEQENRLYLQENNVDLSVIEDIMLISKERAKKEEQEEKERAKERAEEGEKRPEAENSLSLNEGSVQQIDIGKLIEGRVQQIDIGKLIGAITGVLSRGTKAMNPEQARIKAMELVKSAKTGEAQELEPATGTSSRIMPVER